MKSILLVGLGSFGRAIAKNFNDMNCEVMGIDNVEEKVNVALPDLIDGQIGDSTRREFLNTLGVENFDLCIVSMTNHFQQSLETTYLLKEFGAKKVVSVADKELQETLLRRAGADDVVNPEKIVAEWTATRFGTDNLLDYQKIDDNCSIFEIVVPEYWVGKTLIELNVRQQFGISVIGIKKEGKMNLSISTGIPFTAGDTVLVAGGKESLSKIMSKAK